MFVLDKSSYDSITLLFSDLVCYYTLPCSPCTAASSASTARWSVGPWFLSCQGVQGSWLSCGPHFTSLHLYLNFLSLLNSTESFLLDPVFPGVFLTMARHLLAAFSVQFCDLFPYDVHIGFFMFNFLSCRDGCVYGSVVAHWWESRFRRSIIQTLCKMKVKLQYSEFLKSNMEIHVLLFSAKIFVSL